MEWPEDESSRSCLIVPIQKETKQIGFYSQKDKRELAYFSDMQQPVYFQFVLLSETILVASYCTLLLQEWIEGKCFFVAKNHQDRVDVKLNACPVFHKQEQAVFGYRLAFMVNIIFQSENNNFAEDISADV